MDYKDYYSILGIPRDADEQAIKSAFRRMARVYHPDVNENKAEATEKFKELNEAYTVLSDPDKRARYDLFNGRFEQYQRAGSSRPGYGDAGTQPGYGAASSAGPQQSNRGQSQRRTSSRTVDEEDFERIFRGFAWAYSQASSRRTGSSGRANADFSDFFEALFGNLWGNMDAGPAREPSAVRPGRDIEVNAEISLEDALRGATRTLTYSDGRKVEVTIPPGIASGARLRIRGQGERVFGRPRGDLYMTVRVQPHPFFTREGDDLRVQVTADYETAMRSGEVTVPTMDSAVKLRIPAGTRSGQSFRLRGLGMPNLLDPTVRGDLIATVVITAPASTQSNRATRSASASRSARTAPASGKAGGLWRRLRAMAGAILTTVGLAALAVQAVLATNSGWPLLAALALVLLVLGIAGRSWWALAGSALGLAGSVWMASQAEVVTAASIAAQAWPLLPLALGIALLRWPWPRRA